MCGMAFQRVTKTAEARRVRQARRRTPIIVPTRTELQNGCEAALRSYVEVMQHGCALLSKIKQIPIPEEEQNRIFSYRKLEISAQTRYSKARKALWNFLLIDSTDSH
jgi:hypothetical protein